MCLERRLEAEAKLSPGLVDMQRLAQENAQDLSNLVTELQQAGLEASLDSCASFNISAQCPSDAHQMQSKMCPPSLFLFKP